jgi:hypothetical protein
VPPPEIKTAILERELIKFLLQNLIRQLRARPAPGLIHYQPDKKPEKSLLAGQVLCGVFPVFVHHFIGNFYNLFPIRKLSQVLFLSHHIRFFARVNHFFKYFPGDFAGYFA